MVVVWVIERIQFTRYWDQYEGGKFDWRVPQRVAGVSLENGVFLSKKEAKKRAELLNKTLLSEIGKKGLRKILDSPCHPEDDPSVERIEAWDYIGDDDYLYRAVRMWENVLPHWDNPEQAVEYPLSEAQEESLREELWAHISRFSGITDEGRETLREVVMNPANPLDDLLEQVSDESRNHMDKETWLRFRTFVCVPKILDAFL